MSTLKQQTSTTEGGAFVLKETPAEQVFIREHFSEEQQFMQQAARDFVAQEVAPRLDELDAQTDPDLPPRLLEKAAELGFLGIGVPETYGGIDMDFPTEINGVESMAGAQSFALTIGVQTSIGIAPILLYGTDEQKARYLPDMVAGKLKSCYCLTEPDAGSDANSGKSRAVLSEDGQHYVLNGQKMWITNSGFADLFIVFAKIEGDANLSAFIVEKQFGGITLGEEEKKMGIKGSSTRQVFFNDVPVPVGNLLGERNQGFKIAVNVLNTGRIKLAAATLGSSKKAISLATRYALERKQFGQAIARFGAIQHKLGEMAARTYAVDAALYRTAAAIEARYQALLASGKPRAEAKRKAVEEYAIECALLKVFGSEEQAYVVDEGVQIYGGMGFSADAPMERMYRDARINRIYEGTNEINRMLAVDLLLRRAMNGQLDLMSPVKAVMAEMTSLPSFEEQEAPLAEHHKVLANLKKAFLLVGGSAVQKLGKALKHEQEVLLHLADMLMSIYAFESGLLKTQQLLDAQGEAAVASQLNMSLLNMHRAVEQIQRAGKEAICAFAEADDMKMLLVGLKRFTKVAPANLKAARRQVAEALLEAEAWCF